MKRGKSLRDKVGYLLFLLTAAAIVTADQLTKSWIRSYAEGETIFQAAFFRIIHVTNTGAAFGSLQDKSFFLTIVACIGIVLVLAVTFLLSRRLPSMNSIPDKSILGLILGGIIGNLTDRLRIGHVTDFISVGIWPTFNIADSALTVGVILFAYRFLVSDGGKKPKELAP